MTSNGNRLQVNETFTSKLALWWESVYLGKVFILQSYDYSVVGTGFLMDICCFFCCSFGALHFISVESCVVHMTLEVLCHRNLCTVWMALCCAHLFLSRIESSISQSISLNCSSNHLHSSIRNTSDFSLLISNLIYSLQRSLVSFLSFAKNSHVFPWQELFHFTLEHAVDDSGHVFGLHVILICCSSVIWCHRRVICL